VQNTLWNKQYYNIMKHSDGLSESKQMRSSELVAQISTEN